MANFDQIANPIFNKELLKEYLYFLENSYNPNSIHKLGEISKKFMNKTKEFLKLKFPYYDFSEFIIGGGTQANKRAILGSLPFYPKKINFNFSNIFIRK